LRRRPGWRFRNVTRYISILRGRTDERMAHGQRGAAETVVTVNRRVTWDTLPVSGPAVKSTVKSNAIGAPFDSRCQDQPHHQQRGMPTSAWHFSTRPPEIPNQLMDDYARSCAIGIEAFCRRQQCSNTGVRQGNESLERTYRSKSEPPA
jgi:hypothetical protein